MYEAYAEVFAASPGHREYNARLAELLPALLERFDARPRHGLDIACGVGDLALGLAQRGIRMTGVDLAPAMIEIARQRAQAAGVDVAFEVGDMRRLPYTAAFDLALCFGDSLNYLLTPKDFKAALASIRRALVPGGWLVFDILTGAAIETFYSDQAYILQNSDDVFEAHENDYDPSTEIGTLTVTAFVRRAGGLYERVRETHRQRGYAPERVHRWVVNAGFSEPTWLTDWEIAEPLEDDNGEPSRVFCVCQAGLPDDGRRTTDDG